MQVASPRSKPFKLLGVNLVENHVGAISPCVATSDEIQGFEQFSDQPKTARPSESEGSGSISVQSCLTHTITARSYTKVHKHGSALGRSVDLSKFNGYKELVEELDGMFEFEDLWTATRVGSSSTLMMRETSS